jgi:transcriptional regulator with XRE-family HTH domain
MTTRATQAQRDFALATGRWIEAERKLRGMAQVDLAVEVEVHRNTLAHWESGETMPTPFHLNLLKRYFKTTEKAVRA